MVVDQSSWNIDLHLGDFFGVTSSNSAQFPATDAGYFDQDGYLYYGGIQSTGNDIFLDG